MTDSERPARTGKGRVFGLGALTVAFVLGIVFWGGFNTAMEWTNTESFCISCHEMYENVYVEYQDTIHYENRTGVRATWKFEAKRLQLAQNVWRTMKKTDSRECRNCHGYDYMDLTRQGRRAFDQHVAGLDEGKTCIDCHKGIAHRPPKMPDNAQVSQAR
jgi:cytochrome c-type protein NapC